MPNKIDRLTGPFPRDIFNDEWRNPQKAQPTCTSDVIFPGQRMTDGSRFVGLDSFGQCQYARPYNNYDLHRRFIRQRQVNEQANRKAPTPIERERNTEMVAYEMSCCVSEVFVDSLSDRFGCGYSGSWVEGLPDWLSGGSIIGSWGHAWPDDIIRHFGMDPDKYTVISARVHAAFGLPREPYGWKLIHSWRACPEMPCPNCGDGTDREDERADCELCEGSGHLTDEYSAGVVWIVPNNDVETF